MAEMSQNNESVTTSGSNVSALSDESGGKGSDYVIPGSSTDSSLVHVSREFSLGTQQKTDDGLKQQMTDDELRQQMTDVKQETTDYEVKQQMTDDELRQQMTDIRQETTDDELKQQTTDDELRQQVMELYGSLDHRDSGNREDSSVQSDNNKDMKDNEDLKEDLSDHQDNTDSTHTSSTVDTEDPGMDLSVQGDRSILSLKSDDFSLVSGLSNSLGYTGDVDTPSEGMEHTAVSPESFVVLDRSASEGSLQSKSPVYTPQYGPKVFLEDEQHVDVGGLTSPSKTQQSKMGSTFSSDSIVILDKTWLSDTVTSDSSESHGRNVQDNTLEKQPNDNTSFPSLSVEGSVGFSDCSELNKPDNLAVDGEDDLDLSLISAGGLGSLLGEWGQKTDSTHKGHKNLQHPTDPASSWMHAEELPMEDQFNNDRLLTDGPPPSFKDAEKSETDLVQQMPDVNGADLLDVSDDNSMPIKIFPPSDVSAAVGKSFDDERLSSFVPLEQEVADDIRDIEDKFQGGDSLGDLDTRKSSGEFWMDQIEVPLETDIKVTPDVPVLNACFPDLEDQTHVGSETDASKGRDEDFSLIDQEIVLPGPTESMVVQRSESTGKAESFSEFDRMDESSPMASVAGFSLMADRSEMLMDSYKIESDNFAYSPANSVSLIDTSLRNLGCPQMKESGSETQDKWSFDHKVKAELKQRVLQERLSAALQQFKHRGFDLQNESHLQSMTGEIMNIVKDIFAPHSPDSVCEEDLFEKISMQELPATSPKSSDLSVVNKEIKLSDLKIRLLTMLDGERVFQDDYKAIVRINSEQSVVNIIASPELISRVEAVLENNDWMKAYQVFSNFKFDPHILELLHNRETRLFVDSELMRLLDFKFCWNSLPSNKCMLLYAKSEEQADRVRDAVQDLVCSANVTKPETANADAWDSSLSEMSMKFPGKVLVKVLDPEKLVYKIICTKDVSGEVESTVRQLEDSACKLGLDALEPDKTMERADVKVQQQGDGSDEASSHDSIPDTQSVTKMVEMEEETFNYLSERKMLEIQEVASNQTVEIRACKGEKFGFEFTGQKRDVDILSDYVDSLSNDVCSKLHKIQDPESICFLQQDEHRVLREVQERHKCCITVLQEGIVPAPSSGDELPVFSLGPITIATICDDVYKADAEVVVESARHIESTPYGPNRFVYIENHKRRGIKVVVPAWNSGKQRNDFCDMLTELFSDIQKYGVKSAAFSVQDFNGWPFGKLVKAVIIGLQALTERSDNLVLQHVVFCDQDMKVCQQVINILREEVGDPVNRETSITLPKVKKRTEIEIVIEKGEIARQKTDVIVNTTAKSLDLNRGEVSKSILARAGQAMQNQAKKFHPKTLIPGEIVATTGFKLDCKRVYHGALEPWPQQHASQTEKQRCIDVLETFVLECLHQADRSKYRSIAFPALGTGVLEIPPKLVARTMMKVIERFEGNHPHTTVGLIKIIIYPKDVTIHRVFMEELSNYMKKVEERRAKASPPPPPPEPESTASLGASSLPSLRAEKVVNIDRVQLSASLGDPTKQEGYDALVMMWLDDAMFRKAQESDNLLASSAQQSQQLKDKDFKLSESHQLVTPAGPLPQKKILHVYVREAHLTDAFLHALLLAEAEGDIDSLVFPLRVSDKLAQDYRSYTLSLYRAVERYVGRGQPHPSDGDGQSGSSDLMKVKICISGQHMVTPVLSVLEELDEKRKKGKADSTAAKVISLIMKVTAPKGEISRIISELNNPPPTQEHGRDSSAVPREDQLKVYLPDIYPYVYEAFLFFHHDFIHRNLLDLQLHFEKSSNRVVVVGHRDRVKQSAEGVQRKLHDLKRDMVIDIFDIQTDKVKRKSSVTSIVKDLQKDLQNVFLYIPDGSADAFHIIGLDYTHVQSARNKINSQIGLVTSRSGRHFSQPVIPVDDRLDVQIFGLPNDIQVYVYEENILHLPVDCIVNAANEDLDHGGGIARVISDAAGKHFKEECQAHIRKYGKVKVGSSCQTTAGDLKYRYVIHTVGPRWRPREAKLCRKLLGNAVTSCICLASKLGMTSVGIPAISSGIFGGPIEECVQVYTEATVQACRAMGPHSSLKEIHFVDTDSSNVAYISSAFDNAVKNMPCPSEKSVKEEKTKALHSTSFEDEDIQDQIKYPRIRKYHSDRVEIHEYELKQRFKVLVYTDDIIETRANAIAFGQDINFNHGGHIANEVKLRGGKKYKKNLEAAKKGRKLQYGDVLVVDLDDISNTLFFALEAVTPTFSQQELSESVCVTHIQRCNINLLHEAAKIGLYSLAMPLLGTGSDLEKTSVMAGVLFHQVIKFFNDMGPDCKLKELHIINKHAGPTLAVRDLFEDYVQTERRRLVQEWRVPLSVSHGRGKPVPKVGTQTVNTALMVSGDRSMVAGKETMINGVDSMTADTVNGEEVPVVKDANLALGKDVVKKVDVGDDEEDMEIDGEECGNHCEMPTISGSSNTERSTTNEQCAICFDEVDDNHRVLEKCGHVFCTECIQKQFQCYKPVCPTCGTVYGIITGNQPPGKMTVLHEPNKHLPGYEDYGTYVVTYEFDNGIQGEEHPNPNVAYEGTIRRGFVPDCPQGKLVVDLFRIAFDRRLMFTIGYSRTTGMDNVVTWNDIHHKTNDKGGPQRFGYPDPNYLDRVLEELAAKGVTEADLQSKQ